VEGLSVRPSLEKGRGVFAERDFAEGELVERCPTLLFPPEQRLPIRATLLEDYFFNWFPVEDVVALPVGYAMLYNHSPSPDVAYHCRPEAGNVMDFVALRPIAAGQEVTDNYGEHAADRTPMWFEKDTVPVTARGMASALAEEVRAAASFVGRQTREWAETRGQSGPDEPTAGARGAAVQFATGERPGMLAAEKIDAGEIIDEAPVLVIPRHHARLLALTDVVPYLEDWPLGGGEVALPFGHAAMYRSGAEPNARLVKHLESMMLEVAALRTIEAGEEIVVSRPPRQPIAAGAAEARLLQLDARLRLRLKKSARYYLRRRG
jgi:hypothetical protein